MSDDLLNLLLNIHGPASLWAGRNGMNHEKKLALYGARKEGGNMLEALERVFKGDPVDPIPQQA